MSGQIISVNFQEGHLIPDAEVFYREKGCTFEVCKSERSEITYIKMTFPEGTTTKAIEGRQGMEYRRTLIFPDGTEVQEVQLRARGSGPQYSQVLREETHSKEPFQ